MLEREVARPQRVGCSTTDPLGRTPPVKTLDDFDWDQSPAARQQVTALAAGASSTEARNVVLLGPPALAKPTSPPVCSPPRSTGHPPHRSPPPRTTLAALARLRRYGLIVVDEVGDLSFEQDAADLFFQLVSSRYGHAALILTSNLPFTSWGGVCGDQAVATA